MARKEIRQHEAALEKGIGNWYSFLYEQREEFERILNEAESDEHGLSRIPLEQTEGFYGLPGYKNNLTLNAAVKVDKSDGEQPDYYIEADLVEIKGNGELEVLSSVELDFDELSDAITLSDVMHSLYAWEYEQFGNDEEEVEED